MKKFPKIHNVDATTLTELLGRVCIDTKIDCRGIACGECILGGGSDKDYHDRNPEILEMWNTLAKVTKKIEGDNDE